MFELLIAKLHDPKFVASLLAAIAAMATVITLAMPLLVRDDLGRRMKAVALEREKMRMRERERLARGEKVTLRQSPKQYMKSAVDRFNLAKWVGQEQARVKLVQAGYRGNAPYVTFLFFRMVSPVVAFVVAVLYLFFILEVDQPFFMKVGACLFAAFIGMQAPYLFLKNKISRRQLSLKRAFPDALDLLLICVESGMSIEAAFRRVVPGDRHAVDPARRGVHPHHGRALLPAGPQDGLREPRQAHRPRGREGGLHGAGAVGTLRHAAGHDACA